MSSFQGGPSPEGSPGLLILYTGGTIGMVPGPAGLQPGPGVLEAALPVLTPAGVAVTVEQFTPLIDSANIRPADWNHMLGRIDAWKGQAVIVVHGTDTMAYTGAALSAALSDARLPVILCGSMAPLNTGGDAEANLTLALISALSAPAGVWLAFAGRLLPAAGLVKQDSHAADAFRSIPQERLPTPARRFADRRLAILSLSPGLPAAALNAALGELDGAVLRVFGAGTMMQDPAIIDALRSAVARGGRLRAVSQCENGGLEPAAYAAGAALWSAGVENGAGETAELALARLWLALS
ncbi:MAG: asparaginase domain-containing protein [Pseudotabrizicola sp.]|uniref:asparaginase domain-containing protein n=1 Tax=Pseudotabrizicola sp. TaxID=2939647 RepID=UPI002725EDB4|nr:asparaginase domain-containing protein [Pseudotabrizicola sp.]MDO9639736.1 asparaginase domain-containing protein [Pseudotabrizicola sp.]